MLASINSLWYGIGKTLERTFENVLVPIADPFNWFLFAVGMIAMVYWLKLQAKYNAEAEKNKTIV